MNILSIDWDFFMKVSSQERVTLFPDGGNENLPPFLHDVIWCSRYACPPPRGMRSLVDIDVSQNEIKKVLDFVKGYVKPNAQVIVAESHVNISSVMKGDIWGTVMNIDFHHDCYDLDGRGEEPNGDVIVNCGNWARIFGNYGFYERLLWISREDSQEGGLVLDDCLLEGIHYIDILDKLETLDNPLEKFDKIFICRSGAWSPPHLDTYFWELVKSIEVEIGATAELKNIERNHNRYNHEMQESIKREFGILEKFRAQ